MPLRNLLIIFLLLPVTLAAQRHHRHCSHHGQQRVDYDNPSNLRSDTLDILQYTIDLDMTMMGVQQITASCRIDLVALMDDVQEIHLDLQGLTVDSVLAGQQPLAFTHAGTDLFITPEQPLDEGDAYSVTVYYHGSPENDTSWGGFYFSLGFAFNLGVGFDADPHNFGRVWFPCFDNFVERSSYAVNVLTNNGRTAYCGGVRTSVEVVGQDSLLTHWYLSEEVPSYLASVAVANYTHAELPYTSLLGEAIPMWLTARAQDTTEMKQSFTHLDECMMGFEERYGPYQWPRVGFVAVPFSGGAMEHATNIAYPNFAIDGGLSYETLFAHELSHHWWGDLVTCRTPEDMWLNEGWASYSEALFEEVLYGPEAYAEYVAANHKEVLLHAHQDDGGRYAVSGVPHTLTYGSHVYLKGADVVHSLRGYMGDAAFFEACRTFLEDFAYSDISSEDLRDHFQSFTTADLTAFFDDWIFQPGFPEFRLEDAVSTSVDGSWNTDLTIRQFGHYTDHLHTQVPVGVTLIAPDHTTSTQTALVSDEWSTFSLTTAFEPAWIVLNRDRALNTAVLAEERWLTSTAEGDFDYAEMDLDVVSLGTADSVWLRVENHWAAAALPAFIPFTDLYIAEDRWWNVLTNAPEDAQVDASIRYYGAAGNSNYFDPVFFATLDELGLDEDDLILLYRPDAQSPWTEWTSYAVNTQGSATNGIGRIDITGLRQGHYAWAVHTGVVHVGETPQHETWELVRTDRNNLRIEGASEELVIHDASGRIVFHSAPAERIDVPMHAWATGVYSIRCGAHTRRILR